jgi:AraC-like DNA-binding protein
MKLQLLNINSHALTSSFLEDAFILENDHVKEDYFIIPKGLIGIYVIIHGEGTYVYDDHRLKLPPILVSGLINKPVHSILSKNYKCFGFRFKPEHLQLFVKERLKDIKSEAVSLKYLIPPFESEYFLESLQAAQNEFSIMEACNTFLKRNLCIETVDKRIECSLSKIRSGEINMVEKLSKELNITSTTLRTLYNDHVGITPKELIKICRFQRALKAPPLNKQNLTQLSYSLGYHDQAHFIHEFKQILGITPLQYFSNEKLTFDFYNFDRWRMGSFAK